MGRFSKNFLPIFFNIYGQQPPAGESGTYRMAILDTVKVYLSVTQTEVRLFEGRAPFRDPRFCLMGMVLLPRWSARSCRKP